MGRKKTATAAPSAATESAVLTEPEALVKVGTIHGHDLFQDGALLVLRAPPLGLFQRSLGAAGFRWVGAIGARNVGQWNLATAKPLTDLRKTLGRFFGLELKLTADENPEPVEFPIYAVGSRVRLIDRNRPTGTVTGVSESETRLAAAKWGPILAVKWDDPNEVEVEVHAIRVELVDAAR